jgi:hypothetical protein
MNLRVTVATLAVTFATFGAWANGITCQQDGRSGDWDYSKVEITPVTNNQYQLKLTLITGGMANPNASLPTATKELLNQLSTGLVVTTALTCASVQGQPMLINCGAYQDGKYYFVTTSKISTPDIRKKPMALKETIKFKIAAPINTAAMAYDRWANDWEFPMSSCQF